MHVLNDTLNTLTLTMGVFFSFCLFGVLVWAGNRYLKQAAFKAQGEITDRQDRVIDSMQKRVKGLERMLRMQEKRINRSEIEAQRKERLLLNARQEVEYFEEILRLLLPIITRIAPDDKKRVDAVLKQLTQYRTRAAREQVEWEETKDALSIYLDEHSDPEMEDRDADD